MTTSKLVLATALGLGCLVASGVGGYLAVKTGTPTEAAPATMTQPAQPADSSTPPVDVAPAPAVERGRRVDRTETAAPTPTRTRRPEPARATADARPAPAPASNTPAVVAEPEPAPAPAPPPADWTVTDAIEPPAGVAATAALPRPARAVTIPRDSVIGIRLLTGVSSDTAEVEDAVRARVTRDVRVDDTTVIPAGAELAGSVVLVEPGGRFKDQARIGIRFTSIVLDDDSGRLPIETEAIYRVGESPTGEATSKIGASAVVGTILGAVIGGKKGAAIGGTAGAAGGTAAVMAGGRNAATIDEGTALTVRLAAPLTLTVADE